MTKVVFQIEGFIFKWRVSTGDWFVESNRKELLKSLRFVSFFLFFSLLWQDCLILFQTLEFLISY